eukprot:gene2729-12602_t
MEVPRLIDVCVQVAACHLSTPSNLSLLARIPEPELAFKIWKCWNISCDAKRLHHTVARGESGAVTTSAAMELTSERVCLELDVEERNSLAVLHAFAKGFWQPQRIAITTDASTWSLAHIWHISSNLRGCFNLKSPDGLTALLHLPSLAALNLSGLEQIDDAIGGLLAQLSSLQVLNLSGTRVGDVAVGCLTYGSRVQAWSESNKQEVPVQASSWARTKVHQIHLARTAVSDTSMTYLSSLQHLTFLDVRSNGVRRSALQPLERRFPQIHLVQGSVLAASSALAAAIMNHPWLFVCACPPKQQAEDTAAERDNQTARSWMQQWIRSDEGSDDVMDACTDACGVDVMSDDCDEYADMFGDSIDGEDECVDGGEGGLVPLRVGKRILTASDLMQILDDPFWGSTLLGNDVLDQIYRDLLSAPPAVKPVDRRPGFFGVNEPPKRSDYRSRVTVSLSDGCSGSPLRKNQIAVGFYKQAHEAASARDITLLYLTDGLYKPVGRASDLNFCMGSMRKWEAAVKSGPEGVKKLLVDMKIRSFFFRSEGEAHSEYVSGNKFMVRAEGGLQLAYSFLSGDGKSSHLTTCKPIRPEKPKKSGVKKDVFAFWNAHVAAREARKKPARAAAKAAGPKCHAGPSFGAAAGSACRGPVPPSRAAEPTCGTAPVITPVLGTCENVKASLLAGKNLLVQGPAGSGKTVFINYVIVPGLIEKNLDVLQAKHGVPLLASDVLGNEVLVCSTTGISAMAVAGSTLHSIMGIQKCQGSYESIKAVLMDSYEP